MILLSVSANNGQQEYQRIKMPFGHSTILRKALLRLSRSKHENIRYADLPTVNQNCEVVHQQ